MNTHDQIMIYIFLGIGIICLSYMFFRLVGWAQKRKKGAIIIAALLFGLGFAPDPVYEKNLQIIQEVKYEKGSQDESGDTTTTDDREQLDESPFT